MTSEFCSVQVLVSSTELSFNIVGFAAAVATNIIECVQNVFSKRLLGSEYTASQSSRRLWNENSERSLVLLLWIDGVLYHVQSVIAYVVMSYLSPVTVSVVNTLKRALIICISIQVFGNRVTLLTQVGTGICLFGVLCYNWMKSSQRVP
eukprot:g23592.t1